MGSTAGNDPRASDNPSWLNGEAEWIQIRMLAIAVTPLTAPEVASVAADASRGKRLLLNHNLHSAYLYETDSEFRELYRRADWVIVDGTPILWLASWSSRQRLASSLRSGSTDWIASLPGVAVPGRRMFVFGATVESNAKAIDNLRLKLPDWNISGINGYVDDESAIRVMNDFNPDLVIVGLGMPRQERFLLRNYAQLPDATYATVGGAIDYLAGATNLAPRWVGKFGAEWLWRLVCEPRRLWHRYLVEPILLFSRVATRGLLQRRYYG